jgi:biopolymer transport protein ExbD
MHASDADDGPITGINVTPLVDVVLVVLIIFMATAPMIARRAIKVEVPRVAKQDKATDAIAVALTATRELTLGGKPVTPEELKKTLSQILVSKPEQAVTISADKTLPYGDVAELLDTVRGAGVRKVGLEVRRK